MSTSNTAPTSNTVSTSDDGLMSVINDALAGCSFNKDFYNWAVSSGHKTVTKGTDCPTGYFKSTDATPSGLNGNRVYDVCISTTATAPPMSNDLFKGLTACITTPFSTSGPKKLTWWQWLLISFGILLGIVIGMFAARKFYTQRSNSG